MDRLSQLPDSIIFHIFWFLPPEVFVRTTILSKRWKDLWTTTPFLHITDSLLDISMGFESMDHFRNFVHRALSRWDGVRLLKFKVDVDHDFSMHLDIDLWVRFAKKYQVQELFLHRQIDSVSWTGDTDKEIYWVPKYLYSCPWLQELSIKNCFFRINGDVQWDHLKSLTIHEGFGVTEHVICQILSGSPRLEVLILDFIDRGETLCIRSCSLRELSIYKYLYGHDEQPWYTELKIWTPNLEKLQIKGIPFSKCFLMNVSSLTNVTLGFSGLHAYDYDYCDVFGVNGFLSKNHFLGGLFDQTLPSIQHVERITLLSCCSKVLGAMIDRCMNPSFPNVKSLQLRYYLNQDEKNLGIIEILPQLKKLLLRVMKEDEHYDDRELLTFDANNYDEFKANIPKSFVLELKKVEVTWVEGNNVFPFLEFLLKYAMELEKMVFKVKRIMAPAHPSNSLLVASQKLLRMPRASPNAQFTFCEF